MTESTTGAVPDPGGRRARKKSRTRGEIFAAACRLSTQHGFDGVTVEQICREADVARGTFFLHFPSKHALLAEAGRQLAAGVRSELAERPRSTASEYRTLLDRLAEEWPQRGALLRPMLAALLAGASNSIGAELRDVVEEMVSRGQSGGELRRDVEPRLAASALLAGATALVDASEGLVAPARDQLVSLVLRGQLAGKPRLKWTPAVPSAAT